MSRTIGKICVGLGAFLLVLAPMLRFYAYPNLAVVPLDQYSVGVSVGPGATVLDLGTLSEVQTDITSTRTTRGDVKASDDETAVWDTFVNTTNSEGTTLTASTERAGFDRNTAMAVNGFGENYDGEAVKHEGLIFKFPFNTQKQDYAFWDSSLSAATPIKFEGEEELEGITVYKFVQTIEPTAIAQLDVPGSLVGSSESGVTADRVYENVRTLYIEPNTGVIIKGGESQYSRLQYNGVDGATVTKVDIGYRPADVKANAEEYGSLGSQLNLVRNVIPLWGGLLGAVLLGAGLFLNAKNRDDGYMPKRAESTA